VQAVDALLAGFLSVDQYTDMAKHILGDKYTEKRWVNDVRVTMAKWRLSLNWENLPFPTIMQKAVSWVLKRSVYTITGPSQQLATVKAPRQCLSLLSSVYEQDEPCTACVTSFILNLYGNHHCITLSPRQTTVL